jgi:hypothetical protein
MSANIQAELDDIKGALDHLEEHGASPAAVEEIRNRLRDIEGLAAVSQR